MKLPWLIGGMTGQSFLLHNAIHNNAQRLKFIENVLYFFHSLQQIYQLDGEFSESESLSNHFEKNGKCYLLDLDTEKKQISITWE